MRQLSAVLAAVALVGATYGALSAQGAAPPEDEAAVKKTLQTMVRAVNKDDLSNMLAQYSDDAKIYSRVVNGHVSKESTPRS